MAENQQAQSYESILAQLNAHVSKLERDETGIDELTQSINRAYDLVSLLRSRLADAEAQLVEVISVRQADVQVSETQEPKT
jgi:exodeoxyribonuclease VII small subunit